MKKLHENQLEQALLGILINHPEFLQFVKPIIELDFFYEHKHKLIYSALLDLENEKCDLILLGDYLKKNNRLEKVGKYAYLSDLIESYEIGTDTSATVVFYAKNLREDHNAKLAFEASQKLQNRINLVNEQKLNDEQYSIYDAIKETTSKFQELLAVMGSRQNKVSAISEIVPGVITQMEQAAEGKIQPLLSTGFPNLDFFLGGGFHKAEFNILAARPSVGKTALAVNIANNLSPEKGILFISLETTNESIVTNRLMPLVARIESTKLKQPKQLSDDDWSKIFESCSGFGAYTNFKICDQSVMKISDIENLVQEQMKHENGISLLIIDYLQLIRNAQKFNIREQEIANISLRLKALIKEYGLYSLVLAQLNRETERQKRPPIMSDLRESGQLEQDADTIIFLHDSKEEDKKNILTAIVAKNKNGAKGETEFYFNKRFTEFEPLENNNYSNTIL
jgi:replicative DNA helicase